MFNSPGTLVDTALDTAPVDEEVDPGVDDGGEVGYEGQDLDEFRGSGECKVRGESY